MVHMPGAIVTVCIGGACLMEGETGYGTLSVIRYPGLWSKARRSGRTISTARGERGPGGSGSRRLNGQGPEGRVQEGGGRNMPVERGMLEADTGIHGCVSLAEDEAKRWAGRGRYQGSV